MYIEKEKKVNQLADVLDLSIQSRKFLDLACITTLDHIEMFEKKSFREFCDGLGFIKEFNEIQEAMERRGYSFRCKEEN